MDVTSCPTSRPPRLLNEAARPSRPHFVILAMSWAGWLFDFYDLLLFSFLLVPIRKTLGLSEVSLSLLLGASLAATAVGGIVFGYLADRFGRKTVLSWTILVYSIGTFLCGTAQGFASLLAFRVLTGLGVGGEWATGQTLVGYSIYSLIWAAGLLAVTWFWGAIASWPWLTLGFMFLVGLGTGNFSGYGPIFTEIFPTRVRNTAMGTAFNLARGAQFFTPLIITHVAARHGLAGGISLAAFFALFTGAWVWLLPETRGTVVRPREVLRPGGGSALSWSDDC